MSARAALAPQHEARPAAPFPRADDARIEARRPDVRVIVGGAAAGLPCHTRARGSAVQHGMGGKEDAGRARRSLQGQGYGFTRGELAFASGAGALFTVASLAAVLL